MAEALLILETLVFLLGFNYIFSRDRLVGLFYLFLYLYALPAQIGYHYVSALSVLIDAYFGDAIWYPATVFIILSFASFWAIFAFFRRQFVAVIPLSVCASPSRHRATSAFLAGMTTGAAVLYELAYLTINYADVNWYTAQDESLVSQRIGYFMFIFVFKLLVAGAITMYVLVRQQKSVLPKKLQTLLFTVVLGVLVGCAVRLGNRTDLLAFILGVAVFESSRLRFTITRIVKVMVVAIALFSILMVIGLTRYEGGAQEVDLLASILGSDYYAPAHMLFAAVAYHLIDPIEVLISNASNSLIMLHYPYLQTTITATFNPGVATRSAGYAFYVLTEGYLFGGGAGFLYNGIVLMLGISLWRKLAATNSPDLSLFLRALMGCMIVNLVRGQTSYFIKYLYTFVLPGAILYAALSGITLKMRLRVASSTRLGVARDGWPRES